MDKIGQGMEPHVDQENQSAERAGEVTVDSAALARLLDEVRNDTAFNPTAYNRTYNRHNR